MIRLGIVVAACVGFSATKEKTSVVITSLTKTGLTLNIKNLPQEFLREEAWAKRK
jgi:hypothetical protein